MTELERKALLPAGLSDTLPPDAAREADVVERLIGRFAAYGYARVKAPLIEFEDGLLSGPGAAMAAHTFRLMDPVSQRMLGVRADITPQIARIAATRLSSAPRPMRLSYAGAVLRVKGTQLRPEREFVQVGVELIGASSAAADAEIVVMVADALARIGIADISIDLNIPPLVGALVEGIDHEQRVALRAALDHKDVAAVAGIGGSIAAIAQTLIAAAGPAARALGMLEKLTLPPAAAVERARLGEVIALIGGAAPELRLTVDPVENRGFEYHSGIGFTIFSRTDAVELGSGGRYQAANGGQDGEPATGFTLYVEALLRLLPPADAQARLFVPAGIAAKDLRNLREAGWIAVAALATVADPRAEARRLGCSHLLADGRIERVA